MGMIADWRSKSTIPVRIVVLWKSICTRWNPFLVIVVAWAALTMPLVFFRGFNSDEGLAVSIARTALEHGNWFVPHVFNVRFVERPTLLSWIIAAVSTPFGSVTQISARLPIVIFLLFGCLLIYSLLRKVAASAPAALLGTALFLACPSVMRSYVLVTADMPLAVLLFFAFVLWWNGHQQGSAGLGRWLAIGAVLAVAGLLKGPQPIAYFALGVGLFILGSRSWRQIPGFLLAGTMCVIPLAAWYGSIYVPGDEATWARFMRLRPSIPGAGPVEESLRLLSETLPAALLAAAFLFSQKLGGKRLVPPAFVWATASYAFVTSLVILFWPTGSTAHYFYPMILPLGVFGGLAYDSLGKQRPEIVAPVLVLTAGLLTYALTYSVVASPLMPMQFRQTQIEAAQITKFVQQAPGPIYTTGAAALNVLAYVPGRIFAVTLNELESVQGPAWMVLPTADAEALLSQRAGKLRLVATMQPSYSEEWRLLRLEN